VKLFACLAVLFVSFAFVSSAALAQTTQSADTAALEQLNATWLNAYKTRDVAAVERVLADDFQAVYPGDQVRTKADVLKGLTSPTGTITDISWDKLKILVFGDMALVRGVTHVAGTNAQGAAFTSSNDYADVYVKRAGTWRAVSAHVVRITN
jgi:ketosteroid isomerase-like protein